MRTSSPRPPTCARPPSDVRARLGFGGEAEQPVARSRRSGWPSRGCGRPLRSGRSSPTTAASGSATRSARPTATSSAAFAARSTTRPTSSPAPATRPRSRRCSAGAPTRARRRSRTAAGPASSAGSSRGSAGDYAGAVSVDLGALDRVLEVDPVSRAARIQAGVLGPALNEQLAEHGLTLRHFPQSFEYSTLGGWIATRAGRPLRHRLDPHRRPGRVGARAHPDRRLGEPPAAGLGRRSEPRPDADRLRGHPRGDHRGLGARPRAPAAQALGRGRVRFVRDRG